MQRENRIAVALLPFEEELWRLPQVLKKVPVGKSTWWAGVASGRFPCAYKLGPKTTVWKKSDIETLIANLASKGGL